MKNILFLILLLPTFLSAQPNRDKNRDKMWLFGLLSAGHASSPLYGNSVLNFNTEPPTYYFQYMTTDFKATSSSLCDTVGNLLCYTNGTRIGNKNFVTMQNGDSLDRYGHFLRYPNGLGAFQGALILPALDKKNASVVFYSRGKILSNGQFFPGVCILPILI